MRSLRVVISLALVALLTSAGLAVADYSIKDGNSALQTVFSFVCSTTKICPAHVIIDSTGAEKGVAANPVTVNGPASNASSAVAPSSTNQSTVAYMYGYNGATYDQLQVDGSKNLKVAPQGSASNASSAVATSSTNQSAIAYLYGFNGTTYDQVQVDGSKNLKVNCAAGCATGTVSNASDGVATSSTNNGSVSYLYGWNGLSYDRLQVDGSKQLKVVLANIPNPATAASWGLIGAGSTTSGSLAQLGACAVTTSSPGYVNGQNNFISCDTSGALRVTGSFTTAGAADTSVNLSGMTALNAATQIALAGQNSVAVSLGGTWVGTITPEVSSDGGSTWVATSFYNINTHAITTTVATTGIYDIIGTGGKSHARVRLSAYTSGTVTGNLLASTQGPSANDAQAQALVNWGAQADSACVSDAATCSIVALLKRNNQNLTTLNTTANGNIPGVTGPLAASGSGLATFSLMTGCQYLSTLPTMTNLQQVGALCSSRGEYLVANYDTRFTGGSITTQDIASSSTTGQNGASIVTGTPTANSAYAQAINGQGAARLTISGTWTGTLAFEGTVDGTNWSNLEGRVVGAGYSQRSVTGNGTFMIATSGLAQLRVRATAAMTGTVSVAVNFSGAAGLIQIANPLRMIDNGSGAELSIKAASTPAVTTDTAAVVENRPCTPYHLSGGTAATNNATNIKGSAGTLCDITPINTTATVYFLKIYDLATSPTCSSATGLKHVYPIPSGTSGNGLQRSLPMGETYANGIGFCVTGGGGDTDNTSAATGVYIEASYK